MINALIYIAVGYGLAQIVSVAKLKALYAKLRGLAADGVGEADDFKVGGSSSDD